MRALLVVAFAAVVVVASPYNLGNVMCPTSSGATDIGCYCTSGCSIDGDTSFPWSAPQFPPPAITAANMGNDTICAKITIPATGIAASTNLSAYLGVTGQISRTGAPYTGVVNNSQVTIWTAFTTAECENFVRRVRNLVAAQPIASALHVDLCATDLCNTVNLPSTPSTSAAVANQPSQLPGACPMANQANTACYCTYGCSVNGDTVGFPWKAPSWPPVGYTAAQVGSDTICARVTVPVRNTVNGRNVTSFLGITGDINRTGTSNYFGAATGQTVTIYTAFTQAECARFVQIATTMTNEAAVQTSVLLCNTSNCNAVPETTSGPSLPGAASTNAIGGAVLTLAAGLMVVAFGL